MRFSASLLSLLLTASASFADAPIFAIDQTQLPFDLGPGAPANAPSRPTNSPNAAANSSANAANSSASYGNSARNPANEKRLIFTADGDVLGYYAPAISGTLNLFDVNGKRVIYRPRGTKSLFSNDGRWCGTVASNDGGGFAFGIIQGCASLF